MKSSIKNSVLIIDAVEMKYGVGCNVDEILKDVYKAEEEYFKIMAEYEAAKKQLGYERADGSVKYDKEENINVLKSLRRQVFDAKMKIDDELQKIDKRLSYDDFTNYKVRDDDKRMNDAENFLKQDYKKRDELNEEIRSGKLSYSEMQEKLEELKDLNLEIAGYEKDISRFQENKEEKKENDSEINNKLEALKEEMENVAKSTVFVANALSKEDLEKLEETYRNKDYIGDAGKAVKEIITKSIQSAKGLVNRGIASAVITTKKMANTNVEVTSEYIKNFTGTTKDLLGAVTSKIGEATLEKKDKVVDSLKESKFYKKAQRTKYKVDNSVNVGVTNVKKVIKGVKSLPGEFKGKVSELVNAIGNKAAMITAAGKALPGKATKLVAKESVKVLQSAIKKASILAEKMYEYSKEDNKENNKENNREDLEETEELDDLEL